jgi:hypothetical protein
VEDLTGSVGAGVAVSAGSTVGRLGTATEIVGIKVMPEMLPPPLLLCSVTDCCCCCCSGRCCGGWCVRWVVSDPDDVLLAAADAARASDSTAGGEAAVEALHALDSCERSGAKCLCAMGLLSSGDSIS